MPAGKHRLPLRGKAALTGVLRAEARRVQHALVVELRREAVLAGSELVVAGG
jgi:hypothetical protein